MKITGNFEHVYEGEHTARTLVVEPDADDLQKHLRLAFRTPAGRLYMSEPLTPENGVCLYPLPQTLLDAKGVLEAQLHVSDGNGFYAKSAVYPFMVERALDGTALPDSNRLVALSELCSEVEAVKARIASISEIPMEYVQQALETLQRQTDAFLSADSLNPVQNAVITAALAEKADATDAVIGNSLRVGQAAASSVGRYSAAIGENVAAEGADGFAQGEGARALGKSSHAEGKGTVAHGEAQHAEGTFNVPDTAEAYISIRGNGTDDAHRSNAFTQDRAGNAWFRGSVKIGGSGYEEGETLSTVSQLNAARETLESEIETAAENATDVFARAQIANLVGMDGDTENNSELRDVRVGADGTTYGSAGDAVRGQISAARTETEELLRVNRANTSLDFDYAKSAAGLGYDHATVPEYTKSFINGTGVETAATGRVTSGYIPYTKATDAVLWQDTEDEYRYAVVIYNSEKIWQKNVLGASGWWTSTQKLSDWTSDIPETGFLRLMIAFNVGSGETAMTDAHIRKIITLAAVLHGTHVPLGPEAGGSNLTEENVNGVCGGDLDNLPKNKMYGVASSLAGRLQHLPSENGGFVAHLSRSAGSESLVRSDVDLFVDSDGKLYSRIYWGSDPVWKDWRAAASENETILAAGSNLVSSSVQSVCEGDMDHLPPNRMYGIQAGITGLKHLPNTLGGFTVNLSRGQVGNPMTVSNTQLYVDSNGKLHTRICWGSGTNPYWKGWQTPMYGIDELWSRLNVLALGDSICRGGRNENKGFIGDVGCNFVNIGVGGATLSTKKDVSASTDSVHPMGASTIPEQLIKYAEKTEESWYLEPDAIIAEGGINDFMFDANLGDANPVAPVRDDGNDANLPLDTVCGGLQHLFYQMIKLYPDAKRYFLITHRHRTGPWTPHFTGGYTQTELHDAIVRICKLYGVEVIDVFNDSFIDSYFRSYLPPLVEKTDEEGHVSMEYALRKEQASEAEKTAFSNTYYIDGDQIHPLALGYKKGYAPLVQKALLSCFSKEG